MVVAKALGKPLSHEDDQIFQDALTAGDRLMYDVMTAIGKPYKQRVPLSKAEVRNLRHQ